MEKSVEANLPKILLSYEEFERLKHIEEKYIELENKLQNEQKGAGSCLDCESRNILYFLLFITK